MFCDRKPQKKTEAKTWSLKNRKFYLFAENAPKCSKYLTDQIRSFFLTNLVNNDYLCWQRFSWGGRCLEKVEKVICFDRASQNSYTHGYKALFLSAPRFDFLIQRQNFLKLWSARVCHSLVTVGENEAKLEMDAKHSRQRRPFRLFYPANSSGLEF